MKLVYVGESPARDIAIPGGVITVTHGVPFDVPADLGAELLEQDIFEKAPAKKASQ